MSIYLRLAIFTIACLGVIGLFAPKSSAQVPRTELHAITTLTLSDRQFLTGDKNGTPVTIAGVLRIPRLGTDRLPAVILLHGSGGIGGNVDRWSQELNSIGLATFVTAAHPRIDPAKIVLMGFSRGGQATLYASLKRFERMYGPEGATYAAYVPFYAPCFTTYIGDEDVSDKPIRLYHGTADNYVPVAPCRTYVERLCKAGRDVTLTEYPDAHHAFDNPIFKEGPQLAPQSQTTRRCTMTEESSMRLQNNRSPWRTLASNTGRISATTPRPPQRQRNRSRNFCG
jgi:Dienelactone hydrolase family